MNQKEIESVIALEAKERYKYLVKKIADFEILFTLTDQQGNYVISELDSHKLFPIWSAKEYAELCKIGGWEYYTIKEFNLDDFENHIIDFIVDENCLVNAFPIYDKSGFVVSLKEFARDLNEELKNYE